MSFGMDPIVSSIDENWFRDTPLDRKELDRLANDATSLIKKYTLSDPVGKLNEYYQKRGHQEAVSLSFKEESRKVGVGKDLGLYWRITFHCPDTETVVASKVPVALLLTPEDSNDYSELFELTKKHFGKYKIVDKRVYFGNKKAAKRSLAVAMFAQIPDADAVPKTMPKPTKKQPPAVPMSKRIEKMQKIPDWVGQLHKAGVRNVEISYRERRKNENSTWKGQPTKMLCTMTISEPTPITVTGSPFLSKAEARSSAVAALTKWIDQVCPPRTKMQSAPTLESACSEIENLVAADPPYVSYVFPLPRPATQPISLDSTSPAYLYEIVIRTAGGQLASCAKLSLDAEVSTRCGVLFAEDINPEENPNISGARIIKELGYSAPFCFKAGSRESFTVELINRTPVHFGGTVGDGMSLDGTKLESIKRFNAGLREWKMYGKTPTYYEDPSTDADSETPCFARQYMFVPLTNARSPEASLHVDWKLIDNVVCGSVTGYLKSSPYSFLQSALVILPCSAALYFLGVPSGTSTDSTKSLCTSTAITAGVAFLSSILAPILLPQRARRSFSFLEMKNRFFRLGSQPYFLYVSSPKTNSVLTSLSSFRGECRAEQYKRKSGVVIRHPKEKLLAAHEVKKHVDFNPLAKVAGCEGTPIFLVPELVEVMPMPRDLLYTLGLADRFMPGLERQMSLALTSHRLYKMASKIREFFSHIGSPKMIDARVPLQGAHRCKSLLEYLEEATTVYPCVTFQRMEFLGDSVLNYFLKLNLFAKNSLLKWGHDDIRDFYSMAAKNKALREGALRAGINRLLHAGTLPWSVGISTVGATKRKAAHLEFLQEVALYGYCDEGQTFSVPDSFLSDVAESVLAAIYLHGMGGTDRSMCGFMAVALLELFSLPMPECSHIQSIAWFQAQNPCLIRGYPFESDVNWSRRLGEIQISLEGATAIKAKLETGVDRLLEILNDWVSNDSIRNLLYGQKSKVLLLVSLLNDDLGTNRQDDSAEDIEPATQIGAIENESHRATDARLSGGAESLSRIILLRDSLFHIGSRALHLSLAEEVFRIHANATAGDLHLLKSCAITDDVLAYIMMKRGIDDCLFVSGSPCREEFRAIIQNADRAGLEIWSKREGWTMRGGAAAFRQRRLDVFWEGAAAANCPKSGPMYPGLAGGRLQGYNTRLSLPIIEDFSFSFKCIVGAFVLCFGLDDTWRCLRPLFEEVLIMTPDELREEYGKTSGLCKTYAQGKKDRRDNVMKYGIMA